MALRGDEKRTVASGKRGIDAIVLTETFMVELTHQEKPVHTLHFVNKNVKISRVVIPKND